MRKVGGWNNEATHTMAPSRLSAEERRRKLMAITKKYNKEDESFEPVTKKKSKLCTIF